MKLFPIALCAVSLVLCFPAVAQDKKPLSQKVKALIEKAEKGDAKAQNFLGLMYFSGLDGRQDYKEAVNWWRKAAEQGHAAAQCFLGNMYLMGQGVPQDDKEAFKWFRKSAEQGFAEGQHAVAMSYSVGKGVPQDDKEAIKWYRKAAEQGEAKAQFILGLMCSLGRGVPQDYKEAIKWYRKAADQGYAEAQTSLGQMYRFGRGLPEDSVSAYAWLNIAAGNGSADARKFKEQTAADMTKEQIAEGQKMSRELMKELEASKAKAKVTLAGLSNKELEQRFAEASTRLTRCAQESIKATKATGVAYFAMWSQLPQNASTKERIDWIDEKLLSVKRDAKFQRSKGSQEWRSGMPYTVLVRCSEARIAHLEAIRQFDRLLLETKRRQAGDR